MQGRHWSSLGPLAHPHLDRGRLQIPIAPRHQWMKPIHLDLPMPSPFPPNASLVFRLYHFYFVLLGLTLTPRFWLPWLFSPWRDRIQKKDMAFFLLADIPRSLQTLPRSEPTKSPQTWSTLAANHNTKWGMQWLQQRLLSYLDPKSSHRSCGKLDVGADPSIAPILANWQPLL